MAVGNPASYAAGCESRRTKSCLHAGPRKCADLCARTAQTAHTLFRMAVFRRPVRRLYECGRASAWERGSFERRSALVERAEDRGVGTTARNCQRLGVQGSVDHRRNGGRVFLRADVKAAAAVA